MEPTRSGSPGEGHPGSRTGLETRPGKDTKAPSAWSGAAWGAALLILLCWPALANGGAFLYPDSVAYVRAVDVAVLKLVGPEAATEWTVTPSGAGGEGGEGAEGSDASWEDDEVMAGRSIYYGVLPFAGVRAGGFWLTVVVQALAVLAFVLLILRSFGLRDRRALAAAVVVVAATTSAPFFASLIMPDIWAALGIASIALIAARGEAMGWVTLGCLTLVAVFSSMAHTTHILILMSVTLAAILILPLIHRGTRNVWRVAAVGAVAIAAGIVAEAAFGASVERAFGEEPIRPPHLTARLLGDGPGATFVQERCEGMPFEVCRYRDRLTTSADHFLWHPDGVFQTVDADARRALSEEQFRFGFAVVRAYPLQQARASIGNTLRQLVRVDLDIINYSEPARRVFREMVPRKYLERLEGTPAFRGIWPVSALFWLHILTLAASLLVIVVACVQGFRRRARGAPATSGEDDMVPALVFAGLVLVGLLANATLFGVLSAVHGRYQARVSWLLVVAAAVVLLPLLRSRDLRPSGDPDPT